VKDLLILAFFISFIIFLMSLSFYFYYITPLAQSSFQASTIVTRDTGGFDLNSTALTFGSITLGGSSTRSILVNNSYSFPIRVEPVIEGSIQDLISYDYLVIQPYQSASFSMTVFADLNKSLGKYIGNVSVRLFPA